MLFICHHVMMNHALAFWKSKAILGKQGIPMTQSTITSKGQTTLPARIRHALHLKAGDKIQYEILGNTVIIRPHPGVMAVFGALKPSASQGEVSFREARRKSREAWVREAAQEGLR